jgi:hypothetical protein
MPRKVLVPVLPSERFYDAVVAAADLIAAEGGTLTFLFTRVRPPSQTYDSYESQTESEVDVEIEVDDGVDAETLDEWETTMTKALDDARDLCYERGVGDERIDVLFADSHVLAAINIAQEAAAGAYDTVVLARSYFAALPELVGEDAPSVAVEVLQLAEDGVQLLVT